LQDPPPRAGGETEQELQLNDTGAKDWGEMEMTSNLKENRQQHMQKVRNLAGKRPITIFTALHVHNLCQRGYIL
jgi:hypothetical protein